jgi:hypothetical protein
VSPAANSGPPPAELSWEFNVLDDSSVEFSIAFRPAPPPAAGGRGAAGPVTDPDAEAWTSVIRPPQACPQVRETASRPARPLPRPRPRPLRRPLPPSPLTPSPPTTASLPHKRTRPTANRQPPPAPRRAARPQGLAVRGLVALRGEHARGTFLFCWSADANFVFRREPLRTR